MKKISLSLLIVVLTFIGCGGDSSSSGSNTVSNNDTTAPNKALLTTTPTDTSTDSQMVEVEGEVGSKVWVNGVVVATIGSSGKVSISLDTSGADGSKVFSIVLKDTQNNASEPLIVTIVKKTINDTVTYTIAQDNTLHDVNHSFSNFRIVVYVDSEVTKLSNSTKAVYGKVDAESTNALLSLNSNYRDGTAIVVKVFKGGKLVGKSTKKALIGETLEFAKIITK
jgi:hypothetical protein